MDLPSNSHKNREKRARIVKGPVKRKKLTFWQQLTGTFIGEDGGNVGSYILHEVFIPAVKSTISDAVQGGIEMLLFGERTYRPSNKSKGGGNGYYVNYNQPYQTQSYYNKPTTPTYGHQRKPSGSKYIVGTRAEAQAIMDSMYSILQEYGQVSLADLYDMLGIQGDFTDNDHGWIQLPPNPIKRSRDGYILDLPRPKYLQ